MVEFQVGTKEESVEDILKEAKAPVQIKIDMTSLEAMFKKADVSIAGMLATANVTEVTDIESREKAIEMATQARALSNLIEKKRKKIKQPYLEFGQTLDAMVKPLKNRLLAIENTLGPRIKAHMDEEARIAAEAERKRREAEAEEERKRREVEAALFVAPTPEEKIVPERPIPTQSMIQPKHVTDAGSAAVEKKWTHRLIDISKVPEKYLLLNESAVKASINDGIRDIPGLEIYEDSKLRLTAARKGGIFNG